MYIDLKKIIDEYEINIKGVIHIGAHKGEELYSYLKNDLKNVILIEANPNLISKLKLKKFFYNHLFKMKINIENFAMYSSDDKEIELNITNNSQSSSILDLKLHKDLYPSIFIKKKCRVKTQKLDTIFSKKYEINNFNFINIDIQGAELEALKGGVNILKNIDAIYTEINFEELYENCVLAKDLDNFLDNFKFKRVLTKTPEHPSWGDALYLKY